MNVIRSFKISRIIYAMTQHYTTVKTFTTQSSQLHLHITTWLHVSVTVTPSSGLKYQNIYVAVETKDENSGDVEYDAVLLGAWLPTF
jgi:hypothetical protein